MDEGTEIERRVRRLESDVQGNPGGLLTRTTVIETQFETIKRLLYLLLLVSVPQLLEVLKSLIL